MNPDEASLVYAAVPRLIRVRTNKLKLTESGCLWLLLTVNQRAADAPLERPVRYPCD